MVRRRDSAFERRRDDFEEEVETGRRYVRGSGRNTGQEKNKAPFLLRLFAWCGVVLLCFVAGYIGTSYVLDLLEKQSFLKSEHRIQDQKDLNTFLSADAAVDVGEIKLDMQKSTFVLYYPKEGTMVEERFDVISRTREDNIKEVIDKLLASSGMFGKEVHLKHVFRNVDMVYLDFSGAFIPALSSAGAKNSTLFITGVVRTLRDNFSPISKIRFLVDSKVTAAGAPVDLTATWQLPK